ncbi:biotin/lipoate A/B protein ligase family protein [Actinomadura sp. NEAU-AAG7]|uniref:lipoate--protein ligase family protein n=1 Tax=Actinomadura sp. NEAU-AAG7 TaxID=2839640 RepID=UPI001BE4D5EC|nr:biotin/lipoate A/B protein ligase family protein [Actinomadura sp. NEAU-AAG7]MBT2210981.1 lipoate--protein ligase family protein [Actinomadura sp. NEAU-AAG7]
MHGEYKVPGGKLVVVDVDVVDGLLRGPRVSGDFFLEPDEALEAVNVVLEGLPAGLEAKEIGARVQGGLPPGTVMLGITAEAVGIAVRRAVSRASDWRDHEWRLIHNEPQAPALHMALDQVLAEEVGAGRRPPTLRVWEWASPAVVIGSFQSLRNEVDGEAAERHGVEVVRRISGGGAMFIEPGNTITYSLYAPETLVAGMSFAESYAFLDDWVLGALGEMGVRAWYQPLNDITSDQGKIAGAAQKRLASGSVLHHVTMAYDIDAGKMLQVLRIGREKLSDKGIASAKKRVDPLRRQTGLPREEIIDRMIGHFRGRYGLLDDRLSEDELRLADKYVADKFTAPEWIGRVP